jgi:hypothetical protein
LFIFWRFGVTAQVKNQESKISFSGHVTDSVAGTPLQKVTIHCKNNSQPGLILSTIADTTGFFIFNNLPKGKYNLYISGIGYRDYSRDFSFTD